MYTREVTNTETMSDDATLYQTMDEDELLYDDYSEEDGVGDTEVLYDDYWDENETDYYTDGYLNDYESTSSETLIAPINYAVETSLSAKIGLMFWIFAGLLIVILLGLRCIEKGNKIAKAMAVIGLLTGLLSTVFQLLAVWQVFPLLESANLFAVSLSVMGKVTVITSFTTIAAILGAMIMRIRESELMVKVLKWVAIGCGLVSWLLIVVLVLSTNYSSMGKVVSISLITQSCSLVCWVVAFMMSKFGKSGTLSDAKPAVVEEINREDVEPKSKSEPELESRFEPEPEPVQEIDVQETVIQETPVQPQQVEDVTVTDSFVDE